MSMENSNLLKTIVERTSVRHFDKEREISEAVEKQILTAGIRAPSAGNIQPRTFIVLKKEDVRKAVYQLCEDQAFMKEAPLWIVVCVDLHRHLKAASLTGVQYDYTGVLPYTMSVLDAALSLENMTLAAEALGLGSVMIGSIIEHPEEAKKILKLPEQCFAICILCIGYPQRKPLPRVKWGYDVIVCHDSYKDIEMGDVLAYWRNFMFGDLKRNEKKISEETVEKVIRERSYGKTYANHYKEDFVKTTSIKIAEFLRKQNIIKE
jgi:FMN reductase [NAD(P)H]